MLKTQAAETVTDWAGFVSVSVALHFLPKKSVLTFSR
jgi:hypothetical protein